MKNSDIWINQIFEKIEFTKSRFIKTLVVFILPLLLIFLPYFCSRIKIIFSYDIMTGLDLLAAFSWSFIGPFLISLYFDKFNLFLEEMKRAIIPNDDISLNKSSTNQIKRFDELIQNLLKKTKRNISALSLIWGGLILIIVFSCSDRFSQYGFYPFSDMYFYILLIYLLFLAHLQAIGFAMIIMVTDLLEKISKEAILINNILDNDEGIGMKLLGNLSARTTLFFLSGIVYIPILIHFMESLSLVSKGLVSILVVLFFLFLLGAFLFPNISLWRSGEQQKNIIENNIKGSYNLRFKELLEDNTNDYSKTILNELRVNSLYNHLQLIEKIETNPIPIKKTIMVVGSIIFAVLFFLNDIYELCCNIVNIISSLY